jgi:hypothetical protein
MHELTFTDAAREGLAEEMERDPTVFVVGEGIGARAATSTRRSGSSSATAPSGSVTPPSPSGASRASAPAPP